MFQTRRLLRYPGMSDGPSMRCASASFAVIFPSYGAAATAVIGRSPNLGPRICGFSATTVEGDCATAKSTTVEATVLQQPQSRRLSYSNHSRGRLCHSKVNHSRGDCATAPQSRASRFLSGMRVKSRLKTSDKYCGGIVRAELHASRMRGFGPLIGGREGK